MNVKEVINVLSRISPQSKKEKESLNVVIQMLKKQYSETVTEESCYKCTFYNGDERSLKAHCSFKRETVEGNSMCDEFITYEDLYNKWKNS